MTYSLSLLAIGAGGFFGAIARYITANLVSQWLGPSIPYGTLSVNALGSLFLGFLSRYLLEHLILSDAIRLGLMVGFLGAFTTFSTFSYETIVLIQEGDILRAGLNVFGNVVICLTLCFVGLQLAKFV